MVERYGGEAADTGLGCKEAHLPPCFGQKWQINVNRDEQRQIDRFLVEESLRNFDISWLLRIFDFVVTTLWWNWFKFRF